MAKAPLKHRDLEPYSSVITKGGQQYQVSHEVHENMLRAFVRGENGVFLPPYEVYVACDYISHVYPHTKEELPF